MTGNGQPADAGSGSRQRSIYCSPEEREALGRKAKKAGMSFSRYMVACALLGGDKGSPDVPRLVLTEAEQRDLCEQAALLDRCNRALVEQLPGTGMSALGALAFLVADARTPGAAGGEDSG